MPLDPIRSIFPARPRRGVRPASYTANRMLDEPPLIVRIRALAVLITPKTRYERFPG
jgi:hypothetical protein